MRCFIFFNPTRPLIAHIYMLSVTCTACICIGYVTLPFYPLSFLFVRHRQQHYRHILAYCMVNRIQLASFSSQFLIIVVNDSFPTNSNSDWVGAGWRWGQQRGWGQQGWGHQRGWGLQEQLGDGTLLYTITDTV